MRGSLRIGRLAGIDVFVHWTFGILLAWVLGTHLMRGAGMADALAGVGLILAVFGCVVLHELGHALTARRFGIKTQDITLLPIGGVARLEKMPDDPKEELLVALAGPAVNVVIAAVLAAIVFGMNGITPLQQEVDVVGGAFLANLLWVNVALVVFNLLPAFPMDGGRVLRALLSMRMDRMRATHYAASAGKFMAILFGLGGLLIGNPFLIFIALFVYLGAEAEARATEVRSLLEDVEVSQAMITRFRTIGPLTRIRDLVQDLLAGEQQDFPVVDSAASAVDTNGSSPHAVPLGVITRSQIVGAVAQGRQDQNVQSIINGDCRAVSPHARLNEVFAQMQHAQCSMLPVVEAGRLVGVITLENIGEWMMIQSARRQARSRSEVQNLYGPD